MKELIKGINPIDALIESKNDGGSIEMSLACNNPCPPPPPNPTQPSQLNCAVCPW